MIQSGSAAHAKAYFSEGLSRADYYLDDQELNGHLQGRLADRLGVAGPATRESFFALCENQHPSTGDQLTPRTKDNRTVGYDINFHCPKSVSILHALAKDDHLLQAFQESVGETMRDIEEDSKTRVRKHGTTDDRETGALAWADFVHQTARPVDNSAPDPHLHAHCFVFNMTWDEQERQVKAGQFRDIKRDMPYYQARFHKRLSDRLLDLGYQVRRTDTSFEIEGVPQRVIELFSKRTDAIGRVAQEKGITDAKELSALGARTRARKQKGLTMAELKAEWRRQIIELGHDEHGEGARAVRFAPTKERAPLSPDQCVEYAIQHGFERASVLADRRLLESAYRHSLGDRAVSVEAVTERFRADERIIHVKDKGRTMCTTRQVLHEEKRMVQLARQGQGKLLPLYREAPKLGLDGQQAEAVRHVLTTPHRVSIIRGAAGTGKTTLMRETVEKIEQAGRQVTVVAPTAQASRGVLREEGFVHAETVAKLLNDEQMQQGLQGQVLWVDEAGLLGTKDMAALLELATRQNARLILGGDTRQHASVVRGDALRILNTVADIKTAEVSKIYRQRNAHYRAAVEDLSKGKVREAFGKLDEIGSIRDVDPNKPDEALVDDYVAALKKGKSALVISPTHQQGEQVTAAIRKKLRSAGRLGRKEVTASQLINLNLTEAQKADWRSFTPGQVVQFNQNAPGVKRGSQWTIERSTEEGVTIRNAEGLSLPLPKRKSGDYDVYQPREIGLSKGDTVRITRNGFDEEQKRLNNGQTLEIVSVRKNGSLVLRNPSSQATYALRQDYGHLAHAHCVTSYAAQGKTVDEVFISQPAATFPATDAKQLYVSVSRARERARIYTDDKEALLEHAVELGERQSALELVRKRNHTLERSQQLMREDIERPPTQPTPVTAREKRTPTPDRDYEPRL